MTTEPATVAPEDNLKIVHDLFEKHGFHHVPVVHDNTLVGIVSYSDYLRVLSNLFNNDVEKDTSERLLNAMLAKDVMSTNMMTLHPYETVNHAVNLFEINQFHAIPIVETTGRLVGILTTYDLVLFLKKILSEQ